MADGVTSSGGTFMDPPPGSPVARLIAALRDHEAFGDSFVHDWFQAPWLRFTANTVFTLDVAADIATSRCREMLAKYGVTMRGDKACAKRAREWMKARGK